MTLWDADINTTFQSTLPAKGSDEAVAILPVRFVVSIHAPREGERQLALAGPFHHMQVSIHAPREGERPQHIALQSADAPHLGVGVLILP